MANQPETKEVVPTKKYATCVVMHGDEVLFVQRSGGALGKFGEWWGFITESLEKNNSNKNTYVGAAIAGLQEELQLVVSEQAVTTLSEHPVFQKVLIGLGVVVPNVLATTQHFLVTLPEKPLLHPNPAEIKKYQWVHRENITSFLNDNLLTPGTRQTIELLEKQLR